MLDCNTSARADRDNDPRSGSTRPATWRCGRDPLAVDVDRHGAVATTQKPDLPLTSVATSSRSPAGPGWATAPPSWWRAMRPGAGAGVAARSASVAPHPPRYLGAEDFELEGADLDGVDLGATIGPRPEARRRRRRRRAGRPRRSARSACRGSPRLVCVTLGCLRLRTRARVSW